MEMEGNHGFGNSSTCNASIQETLGDKIIKCSADQLVVLEQFFVVSPVPSHVMRLAMIHENSVLSNLDSQQIEAWFENRRSLEKKKMMATHELLLLERNFLYGAVEQLLREKEFLRKELFYASIKYSPAPGVPRSVYENLKMASTQRQLLLVENEYLRNEVRHLHRGNKFIHNLLENVDEITNSEAAVNFDYLSRAASWLLSFSGTMTKFPPRTPIACDWVPIPRMKFFEKTKEISVKTCLDWTYFPANGIIVDASVMLSFVKGTMLPDGLLNLFLHCHQEFVVFCSVEDIKLDHIFFKDGEKSSTAIVPARLPLDIKLKKISFKDEEESLTASACSFLPQDIKLDKIAFKDHEGSLTAVFSAFVPQRVSVVLGHYCVFGEWHYVPNGPAASGEVKMMLRFKFIN